MNRTFKQNENVWYAENVQSYIGIDHKANGMVLAHSSPRNLRLGVRVDDNGKYDALLNDGIALLRSEKFETFEQADAAIDELLAQYRSHYKNTTMMPLANYVKTYGKQMSSKYAGRDVLGREFSAGANIYYSNRGTLVSE